MLSRKCTNDEIAPQTWAKPRKTHFPTRPCAKQLHLALQQLPAAAGKTCAANGRTVTDRTAP